jgi:para-aminobenzoate synthetase/4-amino-4-deoxychorismate lyase
MAPLTAPCALVHDAATGRWLAYRDACRVVAARCLADVLPALASVAEAVEREGLHAAGFVSYEAASAFDQALPAKTDPEFPLLWFVLCSAPEVMTVDSAAVANVPPLEWTCSITPEHYRSTFDRVRAYIAAGDTYQVNLTHRLLASIQAKPTELFGRLIAAQQASYGAFIDTGDWVVCSASPELFFRLDGNRIESRPMKGTAARGLWYADDCHRADELQVSPKERAENVMIVDMVRNDLGRIADVGTVAVTELCATERYPTVWQMVSHVTARTRAPLTEIFSAIFPPASITGAPKCRTMEIIDELEPTPRRVYTGAIGFIAPGRRAQFNVAIRTVLIDRRASRAEYGVGGGVVWDSQCEREWEECQVKARVLRSAPEEFRLLETLLWKPESGYWLLEDHMQRLRQSATYFCFAIDADAVKNALTKAAGKFVGTPHRVRLLVGRAGEIGIEPTPLTRTVQGFGDVRLACTPVDASNAFLYHKTTNRGIYTEALQSCPGSADVILFNGRGEVTESTIANIAVEIDGTLCTPPVQCGLLPGTYRAHLLAQGEVEERMIDIATLLNSPRVYLFNSVRGMHRVNVIADENIPSLSETQ